MLALAAANAIGAVLFGTLYAVAGAGRVSQTGFVACLTVLFVLATVLWVRVEARHGALGARRRVGRVAAGLMLVVVGAPIAVLMPLFWLDGQLPTEAGLNRLLAPVMTLVLISLALTVLVNVVGGLVAVAATLAGRARAGRS